jgi:hypothetical protein
MTEYIITETELKAMCSQMSLGGYNISAEQYSALIRSRPYQSEREKVLDELKGWCNQRWFEVESDDGETFSVIHVGDIIAKIAELRQVKE